MTSSPRVARVSRSNLLLSPHALALAAGALLVLPGCPKVCSDDGFAWQQDPSCLAQASATDGSTGGASDSSGGATEPTGGATMGGGGTKWCVDADKDGHGDPDNCTEVPPGGTPPPGSVDNDDDCDDSDEFTFPGAAPNDDPDACMRDADGDGWGDANPPGGGGGGSGAVPGTDCDDSDAFTFPGAAPNDDPDACMKDADGDDWGDANPPGGGGGGVMPGTDCDDANSSAWAHCSGCTDADMDGWLADCDAYPPDHPKPDCDDADPNTFPGSAPNDDPDACMTDADGDDWGDADPSGPGVEPGTDCDDQSAETYPGAASEDDPLACMQDADGDGWGDAHPSGPGVAPGADCYDANPLLNPAALVLVTAPLNTGSIDQVDVDTGTVSPYAMVDVAGIVPWIPTSLTVNPADGSVVAALAFNKTLVTMNYCGAGKPTPMPAAHNKSLCGLSYDGAGNLYGIDGQVDQLLFFNPDGSLSGVKALTFEGQLLNVADCGMAYDCHGDRLLLSDTASGGIYAVSTADGSTTKVADLPNEDFGAGLEYDPKTHRALSCNQTSFLSIAVDGSSDFTPLPALSEAADDLMFGPKCQ